MKLADLNMEVPAHPEIPVEQAGWSPYAEENPFISHVGPLLQRNSNGQFQFGFRVEKIHTNVLNVVHGGMLCAFADHALGQLVWHSTGRKAVVTIQLDIAFVAAARLGDLVYCRSELIRSTRSLCFVRGSLWAADLCVATATGVWKVVG